jgi:hypothetical protein
MRKYLLDYGLEWVGPNNTNEDNHEDSQPTHSTPEKKDVLWDDLKVDFEEVKRNVRELNIAAGRSTHLY